MLPSIRHYCPDASQFAYMRHGKYIEELLSWRSDYFTRTRCFIFCLNIIKSYIWLDALLFYNLDGFI